MQYRIVIGQSGFTLERETELLPTKKEAEDLMNRMNTAFKIAGITSVTASLVKVKEC